MRRLICLLISLSLTVMLCLSPSVIFAEITNDTVINRNITDNFIRDVAGKADFIDEHHREYYFFNKSGDSPKISGRQYSACNYLNVRITADDSYDYEKISELLGEEYEHRFAPVLGFELFENQHAYVYSEKVNYAEIYKMPGVKKIEFHIRTTSKQFFNSLGASDRKWFEENEIDTDNVISSKIYAAPEVVFTEEMFYSLDTEILRLFKKSEVDSKGNAVWYINYRFKGDYNIYTELDKIVKSIDENSYSHPSGFTYTFTETIHDGLVEYVPSDVFSPAQTADSNADEIVCGDINSDGKVDLTDLTELSLALVDNQELTENQVKAADINRNGNADLTDLATLKQYLSKQTESLG